MRRQFPISLPSRRTVKDNHSDRLSQPPQSLLKLWGGILVDRAILRCRHIKTKKPGSVLLRASLRCCGLHSTTTFCRPFVRHLSQSVSACLPQVCLCDFHHLP